jgi:RHS repeat-associated protein
MGFYLTEPMTGPAAGASCARPPTSHSQSIRMAGLASRKPHRGPTSNRILSSKYRDETGLCYYGYRLYSAAVGRWISRDPIEEDGGWDLYAFAKNDGVDHHDGLGLAWDDRPSLPPKDLEPGCCICTVAPSLCYIGIEWTGMLDAPRTYVKDGVLTDEASFGVAAFVQLKSALFSSVAGCHLHQEIWQYVTLPYGDPPVNRHDPDDYGWGLRPPSYPSYGGTWLWDPPFSTIWADAGKMAEPYIHWFLARVYVEEEPSVRAWYGYQGKVITWRPLTSTYSRWALGAGRGTCP